MEHIKSATRKGEYGKYNYLTNITSRFKDRSTPEFKRRALEIEIERLEAVNRLVALLK